MAKVIKFRPRGGRNMQGEPQRIEPDVCRRCGHKTNVHIRHPNGVVSCAARGCGCEQQPS